MLSVVGSIQCSNLRSLCLCSVIVTVVVVICVFMGLLSGFILNGLLVRGQLLLGHLIFSVLSRHVASLAAGSVCRLESAFGSNARLLVRRADRVQEVGVAGETVAIFVDLLLDLLVLREVCLPLLSVVVALRTLKATQHRAVVVHDARQVLNANLSIQGVILVPGFWVALLSCWGLRRVLTLQVDFEHLSEKDSVFVLNLSHALYSYVKQLRSYRGCSVLSLSYAACVPASLEEQH